MSIFNEFLKFCNADATIKTPIGPILLHHSSHLAQYSSCGGDSPPFKIKSHGNMNIKAKPLELDTSYSRDF